MGEGAGILILEELESALAEEQKYMLKWLDMGKLVTQTISLLQ